MKKQLLLILVLLMAVASCRKSTDQLTQTNGQSQVNKAAARMATPIRGSIHYTFTTDFDLPCDCGTNTAAGNYVGSGLLTELGLCSTKIKPCLSPLFSGTTLVGQHVGVECNTLTAANGDELYCNILPYNIMFVGTDAVGVVNVDVVGGTGRFSAATGHFAGLATVHLTSGTADLTGISGTINY